MHKLIIYEKNDLLNGFEIWPNIDRDPSFTIQEAKVYYIDLINSSFANTAELWVDDDKLEALRHKDINSARWRWEPGFYAGKVDFRLELEVHRKFDFEVLLNPSVYKLTKSDYDKMLMQILEDSFALLNLSGTKIGKGSVVSPGSVLSGVYPPYSVLVGNPARISKNRKKSDNYEK